jgi:monoamine oxidase
MIGKQPTGGELMNDGHGKSRSQPRAVVIGGSMAGIFAALLLRRAGWAVDVY